MQAKRILKELSQRQRRKEVQWLNPDFKAQNDFVLDPSPLKCAQTTRRAAKSFSAGIMLFKAAYETPNCSVLYITKTRDSAKRIMFAPVLGEINRTKNLNAVPNKSELSYSLPNGSIIYCLGIDNSEEEADKLLGQKFKLVVVDEAAFIQRDLEKIIYEHLKPAVADYNGQIVMISTTSDYLNTFFYKVTMENYPGWSVHKWTTYENPYMKEQWDKEIKSLKATYPDIDSTPFFRRMYLNEWVINADNTVYRYNSSNITNTYPANTTNYVLGIDLGYNDDTAFSVIGYNSSNLYILDTYKKSQMTLTKVAEKIKELDKLYDFQAIVIDNASKQAVEDMRERFGINFIPAIKVGKRDHIEILNAELQVGKIKLFEPNTRELITEWNNLVWDERAKQKGKYREHDACANHLSDATLYAWRHCFTYFFNNTEFTKVIKPEPTSEAAVDQFWEEQEHKLLNKQYQETDWLEDV